MSVEAGLCSSLVSFDVLASGVFLAFLFVELGTVQTFWDAYAAGFGTNVFCLLGCIVLQKELAAPFVPFLCNPRALFVGVDLGYILFVHPIKFVVRIVAGRFRRIGLRRNGSIRRHERRCSRLFRRRVRWWLSRRRGWRQSRTGTRWQTLIIS